MKFSPNIVQCYYIDKFFHALECIWQWLIKLTSKCNGFFSDPVLLPLIPLFDAPTNLSDRFSTVPGKMHMDE